MDYLHTFGNVYLCKITKAIERCTPYRDEIVRQNNLREFNTTIIAIEHLRAYLVIG